MTISTHGEPRGGLAAAPWPRPAAGLRRARTGTALTGQTLRPALRLMGLGVLVGLLVALGAVAWGWATVQGFDRVPAGTTQTLTLEREGYVVYAEGGLRLAPEDVAVRVTAHGAPITVRPAAQPASVDLFGHAETAIASVSVPAAGDYEVTAVGPHGLPVSVALGDHDPVARLLGGVIAGGGVVLLAFVLGAVRVVRGVPTQH